METKSKKLVMNLTNILMGIIIVSFCSCNCSKKICESRKIFKGGRVYYNFTKKELFRDAKHTDTLQRPLIIKETKEIQMEISNFNPLKYEIIVEDTAYDRFTSNIEDISKYIIYPNYTLDYSKDIPTTFRKNEALASCDLMDLQIENLNKSMKELKSCINKYKAYISQIENIVSVYDYLRLLDEIPGAKIETAIDSNIINPIKVNLIDNLKLGNSSDRVFHKDFSFVETYYYQKVLKIDSLVNATKEIVQNIKDEGKDCSKPQLEAKKATFVKSYHEVIKVIDEFETTRTNTILPNFAKIMLVYEKLQSLAQSTPFIVTKSYPVNKDIQTIKIFKIDDSSSSKKLHDEINIQLTGGFRIDVSGGMFVSGLYDKKYTTYSKDSLFIDEYINNGIIKDTLIDERFTAIYSNPNTKLSFGGMIFVQAHSQNASNINYGGYFSLGALFNDQTRWTGSCGASIICGRSQRIFINIGPIISQVDRLAEPYETDLFYQGSIDNIPVNKVWQCSWMLGISWKIGK